MPKTTSTTPPAGDLPIFFVISALHHDGKAYAVGEAVALPEETGAALVACGALSRVPPVADEPAETREA